jgi:hypothetical protein
MPSKTKKRKMSARDWTAAQQQPWNEGQLRRQVRQRPEQVIWGKPPTTLLGDRVRGHVSPLGGVAVRRNAKGRGRS